MAERRRGSPADSNEYWVLRNAAGGLEVWDCPAFGPWSAAAGPFRGQLGYTQACATLHGLRDAARAGDALVSLSSHGPQPIRCQHGYGAGQCVLAKGHQGGHQTAEQALATTLRAAGEA